MTTTDATMTEDDATAARLRAMFDSMMEETNSREERFREELRQRSGTTGPCPGCAGPGQPLDGPESLDRSVRRNEWSPAYEVCGDCVAEAGVRERLARWGVPARVRSATLDNYEVYDERQSKALEEVRAWRADREQVFLLLLGGTGTGKGHLAAALLREIGSAARWTSQGALMADYHAAPYEWRPQMLGRYQRQPVLVIDELGAGGMTSDAPEVFYRILDHRYDALLPTILIGNVPLRSSKPGSPSVLSISGDERFASRLSESGTVVGCRWADYRRMRAERKGVSA